MNIKKLSAVSLSAIMATTMMVPFSAMADQQPSVEYTGGNGDPITHLYLIANDSDLVTNYGPEDGANSPKLTAKVEVPVAINYVAQADGTIVGPSNNQAQIRNYGGFAVHVSNMFVESAGGATLVSTAADADSADEIYLQMQPDSGTVISLGDFTATATASASGLSDGTGKKPTQGEWNIAAVQSGIGTSSAVASVLNLNSLTGKIGGFSTLNPAASTEIGQITWQVAPGIEETNNASSTPTASTFANADLATLSTAGSLLRSGEATPEYVASLKALVGEEMTVAVNGGTMLVRLADVDDSKDGHGLTFESVNLLTTGKMNESSTNAGGWPASDLKTSMNSGDIYTTYFQGTELDSYVVEVSNSSLVFDNNVISQVSSDDRYWIPSMNNLYHNCWWYSSYNDDGDEQFDYYANLVPAVNYQNTDTRLRKKNSSDSNTAWRLRSAAPSEDPPNYFAYMTGAGQADVFYAHIAMGIAPCFCL